MIPIRKLVTFGSQGIYDTVLCNGKWNAIYMNEATVFTVLTGSHSIVGSTLGSETHAAGKWLFGLFTGIQLASGSVDAYIAETQAG
jgi:hypothetical protein